MKLQVTEVEMSLIRISPKNYRKTIDENSINELAENIRQFGLINPITVRPVGMSDYLDNETGEIISARDGYEIVCGERRFRACKLLYDEECKENEILSAKKKKKLDKYRTIPCVIREMEDEEAFDAMMTENLMREDVDPFEESYAFIEMMKQGKSIDDLALKFGKSVSFIRKRLVLNELIDEIKQMVQDDKLSLSVAMYVSRFTKEQQVDALKSGIVSEGVAEKNVRSSFEWKLQKKLNKALFGIDEDIEGYKRCSMCSNNSACQGKLFGEDVEEPSCTDMNCFNRKSMDAILKKAKESDVVLVYRDNTPNKEMLDKLGAIGRSVYDFWKNYRYWWENQKPTNGKDMADVDYQQALEVWREKNEEVLRDEPNKYERIAIIQDYSELKFEEFVAVKTCYEEENEKTAGAIEKEEKKDARMVVLEEKDKKNLDKMNENIIKDLRERIGNEGYEDSTKPLSDVEKRVLSALLFLECGYHLQENMGAKATEVSRTNMLERDFSDEDVNRLIRGFILSKVTESGVTYNKTRQECLKEVMKDVNKLGYDVCVEKFETVYNRRKETINKQLKEISNEVQS